MIRQLGSSGSFAGNRGYRSRAKREIRRFKRGHEIALAATRGGGKRERGKEGGDGREGEGERGTE